MSGRPTRRGPRKQLVRESDGTLLDLTTDRRITASELRDFVAAGGYFEARRHDGAECTAQVLTEALGEAIAEHLQPRVPGALTGGAALEPLVRLFGVWGAWGAMPANQSRRPRADRAERRRLPSHPPQRGPSDFGGPAAMEDPESA